MEIIWLMFIISTIKEVWSNELRAAAVQPNGIHHQIRDFKHRFSQKGTGDQPSENNNHNALPFQQDNQSVLKSQRRKRKLKSNVNVPKQDWVRRPGDNSNIPPLPNARRVEDSNPTVNNVVHLRGAVDGRDANSHLDVRFQNRVRNNVPGIDPNVVTDGNIVNQNVIKYNDAHHQVDNPEPPSDPHNFIPRDGNVLRHKYVGERNDNTANKQDNALDLDQAHRQRSDDVITQQPIVREEHAQPINVANTHGDSVSNPPFNNVPDVQNNGVAADSQDAPTSSPPNFMRGPDGVLRPIDFHKVVQQPSIKITWDWSDFSLNFDQYVIPEQKNRRAPHSSIGEPWPLPQFYTSNPDKLYKLSRDFSFIISKVSCDIIQDAVLRYRAMILEQSMEEMYDNLQHAEGTPFEEPFSKYRKEPYTSASSITKVYVKVKRKCGRYPSLEMDESYDLVIKKNKTYIWANEVWGLLRGLETFSQLVIKSPEGQLYIKDTLITDYPRFRHRGILLDSSRHFIFKPLIYDVLEAMAENKMNVLHWHIVDDQSFPYESEVFPELSNKGAYHPTFVYTHNDVADVIEFARKRGIRVLPEFDTPGHTYSWTLSHPEISTQCFDGGRPVRGYRGPLNPARNSTYEFLRKLFSEIVDVFPEKFIHLGGDEVPMSCWYSNPEVMQFARNIGQNVPSVYSNNQNSYTYNNQYDSAVDMKRVLEYYENRMIHDIKTEAKKKKKHRQFIMWQEVMNNNLKLPNDSIIQIWQGDMSDVQRAIDMGYQTLYSSCWYLDLIEYGVKWSKYYNCDPTDSSFGYDINEKKVLGGEACIWAEYIDNENIMSTLWPRASLAAERLWSNKNTKDIEAAAPRLQEHRCRMLSRGLQVGQISGPDYCLRRGKKLFLKSLQDNCSGSSCNGSYMEEENVHIEVKKSLECSSAVFEHNSIILLVVIFILVLMVMVSLKRSNGRFTPIRVCRNKTIIIVFIGFLFLYLLCYTTLWVKVFDFSKTFHRKTS